MEQNGENEKKRAFILDGMKKISEKADPNSAYYELIKAVNTATAIMKAAIKMLPPGAEGVNALVAKCKEVNAKYVEYLSYYSGHVGAILAKNSAQSVDQSSIKSIAQSMALATIDLSFELGKMGVNVSPEDVQAVFSAIVAAHTSPSLSVSDHPREFIDDNDIAMLMTEIDKETQLYGDVMKMQAKIDALSVSPAAKRFLSDVIWGERRTPHDVQHKIEVVMNGVVRPLSTSMRARMWEAFGINPDTLPKKNRRISMQWWVGFITRTASNIMRYETDHLLDWIGGMVKTQAGRDALDKAVKADGIINDWLRERIAFRLSCFPSLIEMHVSEKALDAAKNIFPRFEQDDAVFSGKEPAG